MTPEFLSKSDWVIFECISGSRSYGLEVATSDTDIKGVFILPRRVFFGLDTIEQVSSSNNDVIFYELKRFAELLYKNNPNILELLAISEDCIRYKHPFYTLFTPELFLSKLCHETFVNYAKHQIKVARGLNKKIVNPVDKERKTVLDFCFVMQNQGSISLKAWLKEQGLLQEHCGLVSIPHFTDVYGIYYGPNLQGIMGHVDSDDVQLSSVPAGLEQIGLLSFNKNAYGQYCRAYREYWQWVDNRNEARYQVTIEHGKNYDAKNMMHTMRLLDMAEHIAREKQIVVKSLNKEELLRIRHGVYTYEELVQKAQKKIEAIEALFEKSDLPDRPNKESINELVASVRTRYYQT